MQRLLFMVSLLFAASFARADATSALLDHLKVLDAMSAGFDQVTLNQKGVSLQENHGVMTVARGNRFRWDVTAPDPQLVVADGKQVWVYDPGLEQVVIKPLAVQLSATPALLFGGSLDEVRKAFEVSAENSKQQSRFVLKPRDSQAMFSQLEVVFEGKTPTTMRLLDSLGQKTLIDFKDVKINPPLADGLFHFTPPADVDVIHESR